MADIQPFPGLRPRNDLAQALIAPPYDTVSEAEARKLAGANPHSFLHVTRPEVGLPLGSDAHGPEAYAQARRRLDDFVGRGLLVQDAEPCFYLYAQTWRGRRQVGLMAGCSVHEYDHDRIKKHELTRPDKEQDRVDHIAATDAQTGLVFLTYRDRPELGALLRRAGQVAPLWTVITDDGVEHELKVVADPALVRELVAAFATVDALYVADGHHRSAAASRVCAARGGRGGSDRFLAGLFPDSELLVMAYNRVVADLRGHTPEAFLEAVAGAGFVVRSDADPVPTRRGQVSMYLRGRWVGLEAQGVPTDPVASLDVSLLQDRVLAPLLGILDPRTDQRIQFVGGVRGPEALVRAVDHDGAAVAFHLFPTGLDQLFAVADAGRMMPPKSTWFEPKLRGGVLVRRLER